VNSLHPFVAIEGPIGVGKTTLARILGEALPAEVLFEVFEENPFLSDFYSDRARYAFQTQVFFLLSRYRQQHRVIAHTLGKSVLVSDYLFDKDWLFAHLNLAGDELAMYERVYSILGEHIPSPSLVIYLKATTDTLMDRIVLRDRAYERQMSRDYIDALRIAYDAFFSTYPAAPVVAIDTDDLDLVRDPGARAQVVGRVRDTLSGTGGQLPLPDLAVAPYQLGAAQSFGRRLPDFQHLHRTLDQINAASDDVFFDFLTLSQSVGRLGEALKQVWVRQDELLSRLGNRREARDTALLALAHGLQDALADALGLLLKMANDAGVDLETAYLGMLERTASAKDDSHA